MSQITMNSIGVRIEPDAVSALEENLWALWRRFGQGDDCVLHEAADASWFDTPIATLPYNAVFRFDAESNIDHRLDALFDHYKRRGVPFLWIVHPTAQPTDLGEKLCARGLQELESCMGMSVDLEDLPDREAPPLDVQVAEVTNKAQLCEMLDLMAQRWGIASGCLPLLPAVTRAFEVGIPGSTVRSWLAWYKGEPVAKVVLNLAAGAAGLYGVATVPEARGLGLARILTLEAFSAARSAGYSLGVLHSTPMARNLYETLGFRTRAYFRIFAPPQSIHL